MENRIRFGICIDEGTGLIVFALKVNVIRLTYDIKSYFTFIYSPKVANSRLRSVLVFGDLRRLHFLRFRLIYNVMENSTINRTHLSLQSELLVFTQSFLIEVHRSFFLLNYP